MLLFIDSSSVQHVTRDEDQRVKGQGHIINVHRSPKYPYSVETQARS